MAFSNHHRASEPSRCCIEAGCSAPRSSFGRCKNHFLALSEGEKDRLRKMTPAEREAEYMSKRILSLPKWTWEGDSEALARMCGGEQVS